MLSHSLVVKLKIFEYCQYIPQIAGNSILSPNIVIKNMMRLV